MQEVYILSAVRTPLGSFLGSLSAVPAPKLGTAAIRAALERAGVKGTDVNEVFMGNVLSANVGQAPARQAALFAGISNQVPATTVNKVCASGAKAITLAAQALKLGEAEIIVAGGMESMSNVPHYLPDMRKGLKLGDGKVVDGLIKDGLWDVYNNCHMGNAAELCAAECAIDRKAQDEYAVLSYKRAAEAWKNGWFKDEVVPVEISTRKGTVVVDEDEEYKRVNFEKLPNLRPVFQKDGTVTAANASTINDGAAALVLASADAVKKYGLKPMARVVAYADAAQEPMKFTSTPTLALQRLTEKAGVALQDIDYFEINEAFAVVALANQQLLNIPIDRLNVFGGAVSLGHPLGASGARIVVTLLNVLRHKKGRLGAVSICNGGGGATAILVENLA